MMSLLAWTPFLAPLPFVQSAWLWLLIPLVLGISMMYKAVRVEDLADYWKQVAIMSLQVLAAFAGLAIGFFILVQVVVPLLPG